MVLASSAGSDKTTVSSVALLTMPRTMKSPL